MAGEFVRNVCVNLGIDPDTAAGVTRNVTVVRQATGQAWEYDPRRSLEDMGLENGESLMFREHQSGGIGSSSVGESPGRKRTSDEVSLFVADEDAAIAAALDCTSLEDDAELVVAASTPAVV